MTIHLSWLIIFAVIGAFVLGKYLVQFFMGLWVLLRWGK